MGNTHVCVHRLPALSTAVLASVASGFAIVAGTTCDFLNVSATRGQVLEYVTEDGIRVDEFEAKFGILCETPPLFVRDGDTLWTISYYFWILSIALGGVAVLMAWALTSCVGPTDRNWRALSVVSGTTAVLQAPVFLMLAAEPCEGNICQISAGCITLMISTIFWVTLTLLTQCQDPPLWAHELNAWRVQKERQQEGVPQRSPRWKRWARRRRWATTLGLTKTESGSVNGDGGGDDGRLELMENGSYYADSNNSRLMLKVMPNGVRPGDDSKSVTTFGDLEDMVTFADEQRTSLAPLLGHEKEHPEDEEDPSLLLGEDLVRDASKEVVIIHSHDDSPLFASKQSRSPAYEEEERIEEKGLLDDEESPSSCLPHERVVKITGLRALAGRMRPKRSMQGSGYAELEDAGESDADIEDEVDEQGERYFPPLSPGQMSELSQTETQSPFDPRNQELLHDWNALHAAANAGIMLPTSILIVESEEDEPEPVFYSSSDDSHSEISHTSFRDYPEDEDVGSVMSGGSSISSCDSQSSDNDDGNSRGRREKKVGRRRRAFSSTNSVASRRSLLELTIEEETDGDLIECGSSGDDAKKKKLTKAYPFRGVKSAPDRVSFEEQKVESPYILRQVENYPIARDLECVSEDDSVSQLLRDASGVKEQNISVAPMTSEEELSELNTSTESALSGSSPDASKATRRGRSLSVPRRMVYPITPPARGKSEAPRFRDERITKAGIHGPAINLVSDGDSSSEDCSRSSADIRSFRSTVSRRARNTRITRMHNDNERRRARSTPGKRRRPKPEVIFDPTLRAILVTRQVGVEYGPDEASL